MFKGQCVNKLPEIPLEYPLRLGWGSCACFVQKEDMARIEFLPYFHAP